jgi:hypothetical protein
MLRKPPLGARTDAAVSQYLWLFCSGCGRPRPVVLLTVSAIKLPFGLTADADPSDSSARCC